MVECGAIGRWERQPKLILEDDGDAEATAEIGERRAVMEDRDVGQRIRSGWVNVRNAVAIGL